MISFVIPAVSHYLVAPKTLNLRPAQATKTFPFF
jgi:hypothetical protein